MSTLNSRTILVLGASGGLGSNLSALLQQSGAQVIGANSKNVDLNNQDSITEYVHALEASGVAIDGIILAAGLVAFGNIADTPNEVCQKLMQVNCLGQISLVKNLLPALTRSAQAGHEPFVVSISGVIAEQPMAGLAAYSASKTALHGYSVAASRELRRLGIRWIDARPGHTDTGLATRAISGAAPAFGLGLQPVAVAQRILEAITNDERDLPSASFTAASA